MELTEEAFDLPDYLSRYFPGLGWPRIATEALFYAWPTALRFKLGSGERLVETARSRAVVLYESVFESNDICVVANIEFVPFESGSAPRRFFEFARRHRVGLPGPTHVVSQRVVEGVDSSWDDGTLTLEWTLRRARSFDYAKIIECIAKQETGARPSFDGRIYFIAPEKGLIFFMYDNRGLDIIATDRGALLPLYERRNNWLLQHERARMNETFGQ